MITSPLLRAPRVHLPGTKKGPLKLKWRIARSSEMQSFPVCLTEMYSVMNCWEKAEYDDDLCKNEIVRFMHCVRIQTGHAIQKSNLRKKLDLEQEGALSKTQINALFKNYMHPK